MFLKKSRMGKSWKHGDRMRESHIKHSTYASPMYLLVKDHKKVEDGELHSTRSVVSHIEGIRASMSTIVSEFLEPLADSLEDRMEVISTEDYQNRLIECNRRLSQEWTEGEEVVHIGADAKALFPSLSAQRTGRIIREVVLESDLGWRELSQRGDITEGRSQGLPARSRWVLTETEMRTNGSSRPEIRQRLRRGN